MLRSCVLLLGLGLVLTQNELKRQHMGDNKMKFVVSDEIIANCQYILFRTPMTFEDAQAKCRTLRNDNAADGRGRLAVVNDKKSNDEMTSLLQHAFGYKFRVSYARKQDWLWLGQTLSNGRWIDQDRNSISFTAWEANQPDGRAEANKFQNYVRLGKHGKWDDTFKDKQHPFVCTHTEHFVYSTYQVTWEQATNFCSWGGMTLAHAVSPEENVALVKLARESSPIDDLGAKHPYLNRNWIWIGASDNETEGVWKWNRGGKADFTNWEKTQPDNLSEDFLEGTMTSGQNFASMSKITGGWDDSFSNRQRAFACMCSQHEFVAPELEPELVEMLANTTEAWKETEKERERVVTEAKIPEECRTERFVAFTDRLGWLDAKDKCASMGMSLAKVTSMKQNYDVARLMYSADPVDSNSMRQYYSDNNWFWIGANDMKVEGSFVWTDEKKVDYTNWGAQQPDNLRIAPYSLTGQHYVAVHKLLRFWDDSGDRKLPFVCQCPGLEDGDEAETDYFATTAPIEEQTEGPNVQAALSAGKGKRFIHHAGPTTFWNAQSKCVNTGGNLACPSNKKQNDAVAGLIKSEAWIGILDYNVEGDFVCTNSEQTSYTNWNLGQPDNKDDNKREADFTVMKYSPGSEVHGKWFDKGAMVYLMEYTYGYVCEAECKVGEDGCIPNDASIAL